LLEFIVSFEIIGLAVVASTVVGFELQLVKHKITEDTISHYFKKSTSYFKNIKSPNLSSSLKTDNYETARK
jgi:hypothetical protein